MAEVKRGKGFATVTRLSVLTATWTGVARTEAAQFRPGTAAPTPASVRNGGPLSPAAGTPSVLAGSGCRLLWTRTAGISALSAQVRAGFASFQFPATDTCRVTGTGLQEHGTGWGWRRG
jgi:hypothetical protein